SRKIARVACEARAVQISSLADARARASVTASRVCRASTMWRERVTLPTVRSERERLVVDWPRADQIVVCGLRLARLELLERANHRGDTPFPGLARHQR